MRKTLLPVKVKEVGDRQLEMAGSTEDVDRMGDSIKSSGWQLSRFQKNPVFIWGHDYNQPPIGRATKVWVDEESKRLMFNVEFADAETYAFADTIYKLYKGGFLHATSVGFIPLEWEGKDEENPLPNRDGNVFTKQELLELSAVPVPANADALVTARKQGLITVKELEAVTKGAPVITKPEETEGYISIPVEVEEGEHDECVEIRTIDVDKEKGIQALYCVDHKVIISYIFDKDNAARWTIDTAQDWVDDHAKNYILIAVPTENGQAEVTGDYTMAVRKTETPKPQPQKVGQAQIMDDIAYIQGALDREGLSKQATPAAMAMARDIITRSTGDDIPAEIIDKVGAVLNAKNKQKLNEIQRLAQDVLDSATASDEEEEPLESPKHTPTKTETTKQRALDVAEVTQVVIAQLKGKRQY